MRLKKNVPTIIGVGILVTVIMSLTLAVFICLGPIGKLVSLVTVGVGFVVAGLFTREV